MHEESGRDSPFIHEGSGQNDATHRNSAATDLCNRITLRRPASGLWEWQRVSTLVGTATHYNNALQQRTATQFNTFGDVSTLTGTAIHCNITLQQHTAATHCNHTLQHLWRCEHVDEHCNTPQHHTVTTHRNNILQHAATPLEIEHVDGHCNTMQQHTATTHCKTLQYLES